MIKTFVTHILATLVGLTVVASIGLALHCSHTGTQVVHYKVLDKSLFVPVK